MKLCILELFAPIGFTENLHSVAIELRRCNPQK